MSNLNAIFLEDSKKITAKVAQINKKIEDLIFLIHRDSKIRKEKTDHSIFSLNNLERLQNELSFTNGEIRRLTLLKHTTTMSEEERVEVDSAINTHTSTRKDIMTIFSSARDLLTNILVAQENKNSTFVFDPVFLKESIKVLNLSYRVRTRLDLVGIKTIEMLCSMPEADLRLIPGFGNVSIQDVQERLKLYGLGLKNMIGK